MCGYMGCVSIWDVWVYGPNNEWSTVHNITLDKAFSVVGIWDEQ